MLKLIIEDDEGRKTVVPFARDEITIGRQEGNTIRLTERNVSRRHARLLRQNGHVLVEDLGSYNGVRINGERIQGQVQVADGDLIQIGDYDLALQQEGAQPGAVPGAGAPTVRMPAVALQAAMAEAQSAKPPPTMSDVEPEEAEHSAPAEEEEQEEDTSTTPSPEDQRRHSTAVIRLDQVEMNRPRKVQAVAADDAPRLLGVSAEFKGQEFACIRTEMRIGRTDDNDIVLDHRSLSRTHAKIVREDSGEWRIIDMQSANGMSVNGESYAQAPLAHGDLIELGHVKLRFIGPGQNAKGLANETAAKGSKKSLLVAVAAVTLLGGGGAVWFVLGQSSGNGNTTQPNKPAVVDTRPEPTEPTQAQNPANGTGTQPADPAQQLAAKLQSAREAIDARDFDKAVDTLETIKDANGQRPTEAEELLTQARAEQQSKQSLDLAQKEFDAGRHAEAQKHLEAAEGTLAFAPEHAELKAKVDAALGSTKPASDKPDTGTARRPTTPDEAKPNPAREQAQKFFEDGRVLNRKQQYREADRLFKKCIDTDPTYAPCYMLKGSTAAQLGRFDEGAQYYRDFLRLAPDHQMAPTVKNMLEEYEKSRKQQGGGK
ncbi:FHA domain-containing protein [Archangium violaceum]|uniref:FHA domain-containing protein n=1 Tax=Archangium violaceum TaxID=83451 RepID=UPI00194E2B3A|nr:FHA domain-containing protein [Archangium violaceum]QRN99932.1 FHA domain-containing protein [Archangium violaceum]